VLKETELTGSQPGHESPDFTGTGLDGKIYSTRNFKGKVILIDLWASWCGPCRRETPFLKKIYKKYKNDNRIIFISIAIADHQLKWKKAIAEDTPTWLQLFDSENTSHSYFNGTLEIPRFIVIGKDGNIIDFDAPLPSEKNYLSKILDLGIADNFK